MDTRRAPGPEDGGLTNQQMKDAFGVTDDDLHCEICLNNALTILEPGDDPNVMRVHGVCNRYLS